MKNKKKVKGYKPPTEQALKKLVEFFVNGILNMKKGDKRTLDLEGAGRKYTLSREK